MSGQQFAIDALKSGRSVRDDGESAIDWAVFDRDAVFKLADEHDDPSLVASEVTGWFEFSGGPGRWFGHAPDLKIYGRKVLVWQYVALDI